LFGKKTSGGETIPAEQLVNPLVNKTGSQLSSFVDQYLKNFQPGSPYGGQFTAGSTGLEKTGLDQLKALLAGPATGNLFAGGAGEIQKTLSGFYADPSKSPFIQAATKMAKTQLGDLTDAARARRGARGTYFTSDALTEERNLAQNTLTNLQAVIGQFIEGERGRQFSAADKALDFDKYQNLTAPLTRIEGSQSLGGLERIIEQNDLEARYNEFKRQQTEKQVPLTAAQDLFGGASRLPSGVVTPQTVQNNSLGNILDIVSKLNLKSLGGKGSMIEKLSGVFS
jgi:hypothetical protein